MVDEVVITHRAQRFALGRTSDFYGVFHFDSSTLELVDRYPKSATGWYRAWARFHELESSPELPLDIAERRSALMPPKAAVLLVILGIALGVASLFPSYLSGVALTGESDQLAEHVIFLLGWSGALAMIVAGRIWQMPGAIFGTALSVVALGFYLSDLGEVIASGAHVAGAGLILGLIGWLFCSEGCSYALVRLRRSSPVLRRERDPRLIGLLVAVGVGLAVFFATPWDSFHLHALLTGQTSSLTAGNAFSNPPAVIAANVIVMVAMVVAAALAGIWRNLWFGGWLLAGALVPMFAEFVSAIIQVTTPTPPSTFGITRAEALQVRLHIASGLTAYFYVYCLFLAAMIAISVVLLWNTRRDGLRHFGRPIAIAHKESR